MEENIPRVDNTTDSEKSKIDKESLNQLLTANKDLVQKGLSFMNEGQTLEANGWSVIPCGEIPYKYRLQKLKDELILNERIALETSVSDSNEDGKAIRKKLLNEVLQCVLPMQTKMANYGIRLDLDFRWKENFEQGEYDATVSILPGEGRGHAFEWQDSIRGNCTTILHELGHHWGLPDEYGEEGTCRKKEFEAGEVSPEPIMRTSWDEGSHMYPRNILQLLEQAIPGRLDVSPKTALAREDFLKILGGLKVYGRYLLSFSFEAVFEDHLPETVTPTDTVSFVERAESEFVSESGKKIGFANLSPVEGLSVLRGPTPVDYELLGIADVLAEMEKHLSVNYTPFSREIHEKYPTLQLKRALELRKNTGSN